MIGICIYYDSTDAANNHWSYVLSHFKVNKIFLIGVPKEAKVDLHYLRDATHIKTANELPSEIPLVLLAPENGTNVQGTESLITFKHPSEAIYMFGSDHVHLEEENLGNRTPDYKIYVPTDTKDQMYAYICGAVTLYDRKLKNG